MLLTYESPENMHSGRIDARYLVRCVLETWDREADVRLGEQRNAHAFPAAILWLLGNYYFSRFLFYFFFPLLIFLNRALFVVIT